MGSFNITNGRKAIIIWLIIGIVMTVVQILLGGITRLTGSGLSITEWKPIMGAIPPLTEAEWLDAFQKYQQIGQSKYLNSHFTLSNFKFIFFWEWFHRLWGRLIGFVFIIPFAIFLKKKYFTKEMTWSLVTLFVLGALQAAIGWIMVQSGLNDDDLYVSHIRLSIHFICAFLLLAFEIWLLMKVWINEEFRIKASSLKTLIGGTIILLLVQFAYGAFMAGLKAAPAAPTWPDINGFIIPPTLGEGSWTDSTINVHFIHRGIAYVLAVLIGIITYKLVQLQKVAQNPYLKQFMWLPLFFVIVQITLGVLSVLNAHQIVHNEFRTYEWMAILHQTVAIILTSMLIVNWYILKKK